MGNNSLLFPPARERLVKHSTWCGTNLIGTVLASAAHVNSTTALAFEEAASRRDAGCKDLTAAGTCRRPALRGDEEFLIPLLMPLVQHYLMDCIR